MKIAIIGHSGAGKSTLAARLGQLYRLPVLHLDRVFWREGWVQREHEQTLAAVERFLDEHRQGGWVIDGTYGKLHFDRRMAEADLILFLDFAPLACLQRVTARYWQYAGRTRPDLADGCPEKLDAEFLRWVLYKGRAPQKLERFRLVQRWYPHKLVTLRSQRQIDRFTAVAERAAAARGEGRQAAEKPEK